VNDSKKIVWRIPSDSSQIFNETLHSRRTIIEAGLNFFHKNYKTRKREQVKTSDIFPLFPRYIAKRD
jgi:hypothetical protein